MNEVLIRIRQVFNESGKTQTEIGKMIDKTSQYIWKLLNDDKANPSTSVIKDICREFKVNEDWLKNGIEPMYKDTVGNWGAYFSEILKGDDIFIKDIIEVYMELDDTSKEVFKSTVYKFASKITKKDNNK